MRYFILIKREVEVGGNWRALKPRREKKRVEPMSGMQNRMGRNGHTQTSNCVRKLQEQLPALNFRPPTRYYYRAFRNSKK